MSDQIVNNLIQTEEELLVANNSLIDIKEEYFDILNNTEVSSLFNTDNIYFYFVLVGFLFLAFALWFLLSALKQRELGKEIKKEKKDKKVKKKKKKVEYIEEKPIPKKKTKAVKIKVVKVK